MHLSNYLNKLPGDFRLGGVKKLVRAYWDDNGMTYRGFAKKFGYSVKSLERYLSVRAWSSLPTIAFVKDVARTSNAKLLDEAFRQFEFIGLLGSPEHVILPKTFDERLAYFLGALRDGSVSHFISSSGKHRYSVMVSAKHKSWLETEIKPVFENFNQKPQYTLFRGDVWGLRVESRIMATFLHVVCNHPFGKQTKWRTPSIVLKAPERLKKAYIKGFFDAEGGCGNLADMSLKKAMKQNMAIRFYQSWDSRTACPPLQDMKKILLDLKIKSNLSVTMPDKGSTYPRWTLSIRNKDDIEKFCFLIGSAHPKKRNLEVLLKLIHRPRNSGPVEGRRGENGRE